MSVSTSSSFLSALRCQNRGAPPLWLMRQAGRYLPSYQALRAQHSLLDMFHHPDLIVEVTQLPLQVLPLDAAIIFADLLTVLDGLGKQWEFHEGVGPVIPNPLTATASFEVRPAEEAYSYLNTAIRRLKKELTLPLIGFAGGPFTVASYLIEGKSSRDLLRTKQWMYSDPAGFHHLLGVIADATIDYLLVQINAGVDAIQLFDSWAHVLSLHDFRNFVLPYLGRILKGIQATDIPTLLFCRGSCFYAQDLATLAPSAISLDWQGEIGDIRAQLPPSIALQGNLDPAVLLGTRDIIQTESARILRAMKGERGFIFNLGHGILPTTPFANVQCLVEYVRAHG